jgi:uncharacterized protein (TIGR03083 family)
VARDLLGVGDLVAERIAVVETITALDDESFERGTTLCAEWAPRDVLAHLIGVSDARRYLRGGMRVNAVNAAIVRGARGLDRAGLSRRAAEWAANPSPADRLGARFLLGDVAMHHQDVLRGLGRRRRVPPAAEAAIFREGVLLSTGTKRNLLRYRVEPTTVGGRTLGRGITVRGSAEALGLWLAGRRGLEAELDFER